MSHYEVRHHMKNSRTWRQVGIFDDIHDAYGAYEKRLQARGDERVWVVELESGQVVADSHPPRRR